MRLDHARLPILLPLLLAALGWHATAQPSPDSGGDILWSFDTGG